MTKSVESCHCIFYAKIRCQIFWNNSLWNPPNCLILVLLINNILDCSLHTFNILGILLVEGLLEWITFNRLLAKFEALVLKFHLGFTHCINSWKLFKSFESFLWMNIKVLIKTWCLFIVLLARSFWMWWSHNATLSSLSCVSL